MQYAGFLIRQERLARNWSQEGLCRGICAVSYLSKIEQGKAAPSTEIVALLLGRLGLDWQEPAGGAALVEQGYELLFSDELDQLRALTEQPDWAALSCSPWAPDLQLLSRFVEDLHTPLDPALELCMDARQLALQRSLQARDDEALRLYPCGFLYYLAGDRCYCRGECTHAVELLQTACQLAAQEGRVRVMLNARVDMGNCYSNLRDLPAMTGHYQAAERLACTLGEEAILGTIRYNTAATQLELGQYASALEYFSALRVHSPMSLHKLAICYEQLGQTAPALEALDRADTLPRELPEGLETQMCALVRYRLEHPDYLSHAAYGTLLLDCFARCRAELPAGYALFHLPWVLAWYERHRQYRQACTLLKDFPGYLR